VLHGAEMVQDRAVMVAEWMHEQRLATCLPFLLEAGYSARSGAITWR
jgi:hypothetical protein